MNIANLLLRRAGIAPRAPAIAMGERPVYTYGEFAATVARLAYALRHEHALLPGERVALAMRNCPEFLVVLFAAWHAGLCAVPINFRLHRRELQYILDDSGSRLCFAGADHVATLCGLDDDIESLDGVIDVHDASFVRRLAESRTDEACCDTKGDDAAWLFYTSGTTGRPKGATLTHRNLGFMTQAYFADIDGIATGDAMLHAAALSHGAGLYALPSIAQGGLQVACEQPGFDCDEVLALLAHYRNVSFFAAPTMLKRLVGAARDRDADTRHLRTIVYGGGPMYVADLQDALAVLGRKLVQIYGQGESPMTITSLAREDHREDHLPTCGVARTLVDVRIVDQKDNVLPADEIGEVVTRSDCVMSGYWNNSEATAKTLRGGWLHTGDVGSMDVRGYLTLSDRASDMIISGGSNIYPREIEEVLLRHADVLEAAVVGRKHVEWGEEVVAFVVARPGLRPSVQDLDTLCLQNIARFKRPRAYFFVDALPKNNYGKVLKTQLRATTDHAPNSAPQHLRTPGA